MKNTGMSRPVDHLGRVVIPVEIRRSLGIVPEDRVGIYVEENRIIIESQIERCSICGTTDGTRGIMGIRLCRKCAERLPAMFDEAES